MRYSVSMEFIFLVFLFFVGAAFGSFIGVVIDRIPRGESILGGRSHCESCKKEIKPYDLVPVLSYLILQGKCRNCKKRIPVRVLIVEVIAGIMFLLLFLFSFVSIPNYIFLCLVSLILLAIAFIDIDHGIIPDSLLVVLGILALLYFILFAPQVILGNVLAGLIAFTFLLLIFLGTRGRGIGFGDVKFAFLMGFLLGGFLTIIAFYVAFLTGALISIILVVAHKKKMKGSTIPFGPFLSLGVFVSVIWGVHILSVARLYLGF